MSDAVEFTRPTTLNVASDSVELASSCEIPSIIS